MDPYQQHKEEFLEETKDDLKILEKELAPSTSDYYAILNISKKATEKDIEESFKKLCRLFHPDKHTDIDKKRMAEARFQVIQKAYEVLSDSQKRVIYDTYGEDGLNATWEVGTRFKTAKELKEEYEKKARQKHEQDIENLIRSKSAYQLTFDATQIIDPYEPPVFAGFGQQQSIQQKKKGTLHTLTKGKVKQLVMRHSFETQLSPKTYAIIGGSMVTRTGMGSGNILGTIRHTVSPQLWGEVTATLLNPRLLTLKSYYTVDTDSFINSVAHINSTHEPPKLSVTLSRRLFASTTGYMTYKTGEWSLLGWGNDISERIDRSSVALGLFGLNKYGNYSSQVQTGILGSQVMGEYAYKLPHQARLRISCGYSSQGGMTTTIGSDHKVSQFIRAGMSLECGLATGVIIKFRVSRLGQKAVLPIILSPEFDLKLAFFGAFVPASVAIALDQFVLKPRRKLLIKQKIDELRQEHADYLNQRKQEALDAQTLMKDIAQRKKRQEEKKADGLVIVEAWYGNLDNLDKGTDEGVVDVTIVIQTLVNESKLTIPGENSKANILGFYDPCLGEKKKLRVKYRFNNRLHQVTVDDFAPLTSPVQAHSV